VVGVAGVDSCVLARLFRQAANPEYTDVLDRIRAGLLTRVLHCSAE